MRVGIFTFPNSDSYGAVLQMYALYHTVETLGHTPEVINYQNAYMKEQKHIRRRRTWLRRILGQLLHHRMRRKFQLFEKKRMERYPKAPMSDPAGLPELTKRYDSVICGSDQVWNPDITGGDMSYFLNFCDEHTNRVAYAPSFGIDAFSQEFCESISGELEQFHALSIRESVGQTLIWDLLHKEVPVVVDPTLLMTAENWEPLEQKHPMAEGDYILYYTVRSSQTLWHHALALAEKKGMKLIVVGGNPLKVRLAKNENIQYAVDIGPEEWLYLVHHARYVVTNSFHGTAFSINYRKDFYVEFSSLTNSRLAQITQTLGLSAQITGEKPLSGETVDYSVTDQVLPQMRKASMDYLSCALY